MEDEEGIRLSYEALSKFMDIKCYYGECEDSWKDEVEADYFIRKKDFGRE